MNYSVERPDNLVYSRPKQFIPKNTVIKLFVPKILCCFSAVVI